MKKYYRDYLSGHPLYQTWASMRNRCVNKNHKDFHSYGGKGVKVCERWERFKNFVDDMGPKPSPSHTLDRINGDGNYEPSNCRWASPITQGQNTKRNKPIEIKGESKCLSEWCRHFGINKATVKSRIRYGMSVHEALCKPVPSDGRSKRHANR